jgi:spore maturation protein A
VLNHIWAFLVVVGIVVALTSAINTASTGERQVRSTVAGKETIETLKYASVPDRVRAFSDAGTTLTQEMLNSVSFRYTDAQGKQRSGAVGIAIDYIGMMALWLGIMKIAEKAGLIQKLAKSIRPVFRIVFPTVPVEHPAAGAILMNFAANMLGLDNAATPLGVKAMKELQTLNGQKDTASNAMCMFLAINVSCLTLLPFSVIAYRVQAGSSNPTQFIVPMLIATTIGHLVAFAGCKICERFSQDTPPAAPEAEAGAEVAQ